MWLGEENNKTHSFVTCGQGAQTESDKPGVTSLTMMSMNKSGLRCSFTTGPSRYYSCMDVNDYQNSLMNPNYAPPDNKCPTVHSSNLHSQTPLNIQASFEISDKLIEETGSAHSAASTHMLQNPLLNRSESPRWASFEEPGKITNSQVPETHRFDEFDEWPNGNVSSIYGLNDKRAAQHKAGWAMRNTNNHNKTVLKKSCLGVIVCSKLCKPSGAVTVYRPAICGIAREKQLRDCKCPTAGCGGTLVRIPCTGNNGHPVTHFWQKCKDHIHFRAKGHHNHARPGKKIYVRNLKSEKAVKSLSNLPTQEHQAIGYSSNFEGSLSADGIIAFTEADQIDSQQIIESTGVKEKLIKIGVSPISMSSKMLNLNLDAGNQEVIHQQMPPQSLHCSSPSQYWRRNDESGKQQGGRFCTLVEDKYNQGHRQQPNAIAPVSCHWNETQSAYPLTSCCAKDGCYCQDPQKYFDFINSPENRNDSVLANYKVIHAKANSGMFNAYNDFKRPHSWSSRNTGVQSLNNIEANTQHETVPNYTLQQQEYRGHGMLN